MAVLRSVISHWGTTFPADQELFPKHDLDGNFHNEAFLKSSPKCCREPKPEITEHSESDQQWPDSGSQCCFSSRGCCLTPNPNKYFILAMQREKEEKQTRWPFSADTTTGRGELQSHDHRHKGFCQCCHISPCKDKALRLGSACSFFALILFLTLGVPLEVGFITQQLGTRISLQGEGKSLTLTKWVTKKIHWFPAQTPH